jgi:hypothetical protein
MLDQPDAIARMDAHFQERVQQVPVLRRRAEAEGIKEIQSLEDVVPLLFPHVTYKSYPETLVSKGQWAAMNKWLDSLSTHRVDNVDVSGLGPADTDGWIARLHAAGHLVMSSSGTTGKNSFLNKTQKDREISFENMMNCFRMCGVEPDNSWYVIPGQPDRGIENQRVTQDMLYQQFGHPDSFRPPRKAQSVGFHAYMSRMAAMRRAMAEGTVRPDEIAAVEAEAAEHQAEAQAHIGQVAQWVSEHRNERILFTSMFPALFQIVERLRELGASDGDLTGDNAVMVAGGLKGAQLPPDYQDQIFRMLHLDKTRFVHFYSMQEVNLRMPKCVEGRYHVLPGLVLLVLDQPGEALVSVSEGMGTGRACFVDTTVDGRWGGTMSGDKITADFAKCPCGKPGPTVLAAITRYADAIDGDKITCAGTMEAYVRGFISD